MEWNRFLEEWINLGDQEAFKPTQNEKWAARTLAEGVFYSQQEACSMHFYLPEKQSYRQTNSVDALQIYLPQTAFHTAPAWALY